MADTADVVVVGAGIVGVAVAWRLAGRGLRVVVVDEHPGAGATGTAAGMLAPVTELHYGEESLLALNVSSAARYPAFVDELGTDVGYSRTGTVVAAWDGADLAGLRDLLALQRRLGLSAELLTGRELRGLEPAVAPGVPGGVLAADDHSVDPRRLHGALMSAATTCGAAMRAARVVRVRGGAAGVDLADGSRIEAGTVVVATGAWTPRLELPDGVVLPVRPVKGQTVRLRGQRDTLRHVVRGSVRGFPVYLVPRGDGEVVVGATSEEAGYDTGHRAGAVLDLLRHAQSLLPDVAEMALVELNTSLRPATPDNAPLLGPTVVAGVVAATGHYRNGVLLAPITADLISSVVVDGVVPPQAAAFAPDRFAREPAGAGA